MSPLGSLGFAFDRAHGRYKAVYYNCGRLPGTPKAERDRLNREETLKLETAEKFSSHGLLGDFQNLASVESAMELLKNLKENIAIRGFQPEVDSHTILRVFGTMNYRNYQIVYNLYRDPSGVIHNEAFKGLDKPLEVRRAKYLEHLGNAS